MASKLEDLITQVPDEDDVVDEPQYPRQHGAKAVSRRCRFCRFVFPGSRREEVRKLSVVIPCEPGASALKAQPLTDVISITVTPAAAEPPSATQLRPDQGIDPAPAVTPEYRARTAASQPPAQDLPPPEHEVPRLGPQVGANTGRKTLVLDLDETLVHSSLRPLQNADIVLPVELEKGDFHNVYVRKRPGVDEFLARVAMIYEVVVYTASMSKYANPLLDRLEPSGELICWRLFREACTRQPSGYVKDLSKLGRNLKKVIIIDNSPVCYSLQPDNAIPIKTWKEDASDRELLDLIPILRSLADVDDVPFVLKHIIWATDDDR